MDNFRRYLTREELPDTVQEFDLQNLQYPMVVKAIYIPFVSTTKKHMSFTVSGHIVYNTARNNISSISYWSPGSLGSSINIWYGNLELHLGQRSVSGSTSKYETSPYAVTTSRSGTAAQPSVGSRFSLSTNSISESPGIYNKYTLPELWYMKLSLENYTSTPQSDDKYPYLSLESGTPSFSGGMTYDDLPPFYYEPVTE